MLNTLFAFLTQIFIAAPGLIAAVEQLIADIKSGAATSNEPLTPAVKAAMAEHEDKLLAALAAAKAAGK